MLTSEVLPKSLVFKIIKYFEFFILADQVPDPTLQYWYSGC
jgi:hypothetical protein